MAIAHGVLQELVDHTQSKTLFITHYPVIAADIERKYPKEIENIHMGYTSDIRFGGRREITFLYKVKKGITTGKCTTCVLRTSNWTRSRIIWD